MVKYNEENIPITDELKTDGTMTEKMINKSDYITHKETFKFLIETLNENKIMYGFAKSLDFEVNDDLEFVTYYDEKQYFDKDPRVFTLQRSFYNTGKQWCEELIYKFKLAWSKLNEMEKYIIKCC